MAHTIHNHRYDPVSSEVAAPDSGNQGQSLTSEEYLSKTLEVAVTKAVLQASGPSRRQMLAGVGARR